MPAATPAAVISRGTLPDERHVVAPLNEIAATAAAAGLAAPALVVVGDVVSMARARAVPSPDAIAEATPMEATRR
jgi:uroporphyrin-III C-methyltransferase